MKSVEGEVPVSIPLSQNSDRFVLIPVEEHGKVVTTTLSSVCGGRF